MKKSVKSLQDGFIKYHGCGVYRRDGSNVLCTKSRPCFKPVNACFWMLGKDVNKKVRTRNKELSERVYHSQSLKNQYQSELIKKNQYQYQFYSTDEETMSDTSSNDSDYDSDDSKLVIDIENATKSISNTLSEIVYMSHLINETVNHTTNLIKQIPNIKNTDQDPSSQSPDKK